MRENAEQRARQCSLHFASLADLPRAPSYTVAPHSAAAHLPTRIRIPSPLRPCLSLRSTRCASKPPPPPPPLGSEWLQMHGSWRPFAVRLCVPRTRRSGDRHPNAWRAAARRRHADSARPTRRGTSLARPIGCVTDQTAQYTVCSIAPTARNAQAVLGERWRI
jgi:hypothetical protein